MEKLKTGTNMEDLFRDNYKKLFLVPVLVFLISVSIIGLHYMSTSQVVDYDIDFEGGSIATLNYEQNVNLDQVEADISSELGSQILVRKLSDYSGETTALIFSADKDVDVGELRKAIGDVLGIQVTDDNYSLKTVGPSMGAAFLNQAFGAMLIGFVLTGAVIFYTFKIKEIAAGAVICGFLNIVAALAFMNLVGLRLSAGTLAALLMFLAASIDDNILIITRILEYKKHAVKNAFIAFRTGGMMIAASFVAYFILHFFTSVQLFQDFSAVLIAGSIADALNTWFQNTGLVLWYVERKFGKSAL
jgi:preprotein translocase subunit SecF